MRYVGCGEKNERKSDTVEKNITTRVQRKNKLSASLAKGTEVINDSVRREGTTVVRAAIK